MNLSEVTMSYANGTLNFNKMYIYIAHKLYNLGYLLK
jgi:hypothetical protein